MAAELMKHLVFGRPFLIDCDESGEGLGGVLAQVDDEDVQRPIVFASRALRTHEKWTTTELEAFAALWALETFREWIEVSPTTARTDHRPLLWLGNNAGKGGWLDGWVLHHREIQVSVQYRPGKAQAEADALSRTPLPSGKENPLRCLDGHQFGPGRLDMGFADSHDVNSLRKPKTVVEARTWLGSSYTASALY